MGNTDNLGNWEQIRRGVVEVEHLISQKQFNASMIESLEVLNLMLKGLAEKACIIDTDPMIIIDRLYQDRWISRSTCEHYHKIRTIGTRALNENSSNAYDASQAYQLLSQEVYTFANEFYKVRKKRPVLRSSSRTMAKNTPAARNAIAARAAAAQQAAVAASKAAAQAEASAQETAEAAPPANSSSAPLSSPIPEKTFQDPGRDVPADAGAEVSVTSEQDASGRETSEREASAQKVPFAVKGFFRGRLSSAPRREDSARQEELPAEEDFPEENDFPAEDGVPE